MIKENDPVEFEISPEYNGTGTVVSIIHHEGYDQYTIEEKDGSIWTLHKDRIKGAIGPDKPAFDNYNKAMRETICNLT